MYIASELPNCRKNKARKTRWITQQDIGAHDRARSYWNCLHHMRYSTTWTPGVCNTYPILELIPFSSTCSRDVFQCRQTHTRTFVYHAVATENLSHLWSEFRQPEVSDAWSYRENCCSIRRLCWWSWVHLPQNQFLFFRWCVRSSSYLSLAASHCDVDESSGVHHSLVCAALWLLLLLLRLNLILPLTTILHYLFRAFARIGFATLAMMRKSYLWCLWLDLSGTSEGSVDFTHDCEL